MYPNNFNFYANGLGDAVGVLAVVVVIWLILALLSFAYSVTMYVLQSLGLYTIAQRRGIHRPWLSWVPVANLWILGSISDQYQYVAKGKVRNRRKLLLGLAIALYAVVLVFYVSYFAMLFQVIGTALKEGSLNSQIIGTILGMSGTSIVVAVLGILVAVFSYIAYYDLFQSCNPNNASAFLVLSILFNFLLPIFVFVSRKKDLGMPPRRSAAVKPEEEPEVIDAEPVEAEAVEAEAVEAQEEDFEE